MTSILNSGYVSTTTPLDTDVFGVGENFATSPAWKLKSGTTIKAWLKTYFDSIYVKEQAVYATADFSKTSDTTLANVTGLSVTVAAGGIYRFRAVLMLSCGASGGGKAAINGSCTATDIRYMSWASTATTWAVGSATSLGGVAVGTTSAMVLHITDGYINVANGGTLAVQWAQNASNGTASTVYKGSTFSVTKMN